jgi:hypothetical protein
MHEKGILMNHRFILFLVFAVAVLVGTHFLLYMSIVRLWDGANATLRVALFIFLSFLSVSFIASIFLIHWWENLVTTAFYIFSATWLGLFINLWMAIGLSYLIITIVRMFGYAPSTSFVAAVLFMAAFLYSAYGVYNAFHPRLKHLEVEMEHLPEQWIDKTAVQLSDVHLGRVHGVGFLEKVVTKVNSLNPDVVFITGDLFDGMSGRLDQFVDPLNRLEAEKGIFYITGNHETYIGVNRALGILRKTKIHLMKNEVVDLEGLQIVGINYPGLGRSKDMQGIKGFPENFSRDKPSILLFHTPTNIRQENELDPHTTT